MEFERSGERARTNFGPDRQQRRRPCRTISARKGRSVCRIRRNRDCQQNRRHPPAQCMPALKVRPICRCASTWHQDPIGPRCKACAILVSHVLPGLRHSGSISLIPSLSFNYGRSSCSTTFPSFCDQFYCIEHLFHGRTSFSDSIPSRLLRLAPSRLNAASLACNGPIQQKTILGSRRFHCEVGSIKRECLKYTPTRGIGGSFPSNGGPDRSYTEDGSPEYIRQKIVHILTRQREGRRVKYIGEY
jgi:hypothetical protein